MPSDNPQDAAGTTGTGTWTFREVDARHGCVKGTAFRAFKRLGGALVEGEHFHYLAADAYPETIARLKAEGRLYRGTVNAVVLTEAGYRRLREALPPAPSPCDHRTP